MGEPLPAPAHQEQMQGVRGGEHLPAPAQKEPMQGVRGGEHLPAPAHQEPMQGVRGGGASASTSAEGANARSAGGQASASTSAGGANARSAGEGLDDKWLVKIGFGVVVSTSLSESCHVTFRNLLPSKLEARIKRSFQCVSKIVVKNILFLYGKRSFSVTTPFFDIHGTQGSQVQILYHKLVPWY
jgi:hypothetical protein